jgi:hypothetical protein
MVCISEFFFDFVHSEPSESVGKVGGRAKLRALRGQTDSVLHVKHDMNDHVVLQRYCTANSKQVFPEMKLRGLVPSSYIHVSTYFAAAK